MQPRESKSLTFPEWAALQTPAVLALHAEGRRIRRRLDEGGPTPILYDRKALRIYDEQQAGA